MPGFQQASGCSKVLYGKARNWPWPLVADGNRAKILAFKARLGRQVAKSKTGRPIRLTRLGGSKLRTCSFEECPNKNTPFNRKKEGGSLLGCSIHQVSKTTGPTTPFKEACFLGQTPKFDAACPKREHRITHPSCNSLVEILQVWTCVNPSYELRGHLFA